MRVFISLRWPSAGRFVLVSMSLTLPLHATTSTATSDHGYGSCGQDGNAGREAGLVIERGAAGRGRAAYRTQSEAESGGPLRALPGAALRRAAAQHGRRWTTV